MRSNDQRPADAGASSTAHAVLFVGRHPAMRDWAERHAPRLAETAQFIAHLTPERIAKLSPGDVVAGTLPVHIAAAVHARGARYLHLVLDLPPEAREPHHLTATERPANFPSFDPRPERRQR